jgi:hypothetical protein
MAKLEGRGRGEVVVFLKRSSSIILITLSFFSSCVYFFSNCDVCGAQHYFSCLQKILYEMRSSSYSMRVSGFSIHLTSKADDGSPITIDKVSSPYNRFGKS